MKLIAFFKFDPDTGYFSFYQTKDSHDKWGIVEVDVDLLHPSFFAPYEFKKTKNISRKDWKKSLTSYGLCTYLYKIPPEAVSKVVIYSPFHYGNEYITKTSVEIDDLKEYKTNFNINLMLTKWFMGEKILAEEYVKMDTVKQYGEINEKLSNRSGLDVFYRRD